MPPRFRSIHVVTALLAAAATAWPALAQEEPSTPALGVDDPVVSWGLAGLSDWDTSRPLIDIARNMRPFWGFSGDDWSTIGNEALAAVGALDENGYPTRIPQGMRGLRTIWGWSEEYGAEGRAGLYVLTYQGRGTLSLHGAARVITATPGRIVFENASGTGFWLDITAIDSGNHIRDISIVRADRLALAEAGAMFDPDWLALISDARELRFLDWMQTNNAPQVSWATRPRPSETSWNAKGAPVEVMVRLANETGTDPWFTMPHTADAEYTRAFATYVRDNLDPRLKAHVELSNELWNGAFDQFHWMRDQAIAAWGEDIAEDWVAIFSYHTKVATEQALIWEEVFGDEASSRVVNILGTQIAYLWLSEQQLIAPGWKQREPETYVDPTTVFEELAVTAYFGGSFMGEPDARDQLLARIRGGVEGTYAWMFEQSTTGTVLKDSIPMRMATVAEHRAQAESFGLRLVAYEGGQHMHHSFAVDGLTEEVADELGAYVREFIRSPEMGALYGELFDGWKAVGQGPFMQFTETSAPSRYGSWGLLAFPEDDVPRARVIAARQAEGGSWWGEGGGPQYLQGRTANGTEAAETMTGTAEEDFLAGLGGDDTFPASIGRDGINGGEGKDRFTLSAAADRYTITAEGPGHRVTGQGVDTYLVHVEEIAFGDGTTLPLD
ncbi:hypothetical protein [Paragemmobacter ruber]|uniref:Calcium-binding protein n=1 Tax=Paragemmobacter ruber TaxID=1985673 RepID=A0ABW9Y230_9RHOB|nr:hypothetical protein [Rhodobacter ruber]NBE06570.1 hypothetical protein [Rhodobacter ruber]